MNAERAEHAENARSACSAPLRCIVVGARARRRLSGARSREDAGLDHLRARRIVRGRRRQRSELAEAAARIDSRARSPIAWCSGWTAARVRPSSVEFLDQAADGLAIYRLRGRVPADARTLRWFYGLVIDPYPLTDPPRRRPRRRRGSRRATPGAGPSICQDSSSHRCSIRGRVGVLIAVAAARCRSCCDSCCGAESTPRTRWTQRQILVRRDLCVLGVLRVVQRQRAATKCRCRRHEFLDPLPVGIRGVDRALRVDDDAVHPVELARPPALLAPDRQ